MSPPSTISGTLLRPNRLGSNGDIELGSVQDLPLTGGWVNNWTSQFNSPLGEFLTPSNLLAARTDVPQMLCSHVLNVLILLILSRIWSRTFVNGPYLHYHTVVCYW